MYDIIMFELITILRIIAYSFVHVCTFVRHLHSEGYEVVHNKVVIKSPPALACATNNESPPRITFHRNFYDLPVLN